MVTCNPNELMTPIDPKAIITTLAEDDWDRWQLRAYHHAFALQQPHAADRMSVCAPVFSTRENAE